MSARLGLSVFALMAVIFPVLSAQESRPAVRLMTLDPGHFHAALVQKFMYPQVDPVVHVYSPGGPDLAQHLQRIEGFNTRSENPTAWKEVVYTRLDFFEKMTKDRPGNVVVISGNNALKGKYILDSVRAGLNVLSDKPMAITPADFKLIQQAFAEASERQVLLYDIMPERSEITTVIQRALSQKPALFGVLETGTAEDPSVIVENVHYFFKSVAGKPLIRPPWFFDVAQQGEGIVDVTTHLVDLVQWSAFPDQALSPDDAKVLSARRWATLITPEQFYRATLQKEYPAYLRPYVNQDGNLEVFSNGSFVYTLLGIYARVSVEWRFEPEPGSGDSHYSLMRGTNAALVIRQGREESFKPTLYIEKRSDASDEDFDKILRTAVAEVAVEWPGISVSRGASGWVIDIPDKYKEGHEAHFAQVTNRYLKYLSEGKLPSWEVPNMLTKYSTIMQAYQMSRPDR